MQTESLKPDEAVYYGDVIFVARHPGYLAEIVRLPAGSTFPPLAVSGMTFDICKSQLCIIAQSRVDRMEQELLRAKSHLQSVFELKEADIK